MPGINSTGQTKTRDYTVGRGCVMLALLDQYNCPGEWREVGNASQFRISAESETLEHFSSKSVSRTKDAEVALETSADLEIVIDELNFDNYATFFVGDTGTHTNTIAGFVGGSFGVPNTFANADRVLRGRYYDLFNRGGINGAGFISLTQTDCSSFRLYDISAEADIEITVNAVTFTGGTDFDVDLEAGMIFVRDDVGGLADALEAAVTAEANATDEYVILNAATAQVVAVDHTPSGGEVATLDEVRAFTASSRAFAVKYLLLNANDAGHQTEVVIHRAKLVPNGDLDLLTEDAFAEITLSGSAEENTTADADSGFITMRTRRV